MKRKHIESPRVNRKVLPKDELYTIDLETGNSIPKVVWCEYHKEWEWIANFYTESEQKARHPYDVRNMCIPAWDTVKGKVDLDAPIITRPKQEESRATLIMFME